MPCCQNSVVEKFPEDTQQHVCGDWIVKLESFRYRCGFTFLYTILTQADMEKVSHILQVITHHDERNYL
jgi:ribonucleotide reductase beta subunit family protein with ferritin-like domain